MAECKQRVPARLFRGRSSLVTNCCVLWISIQPIDCSHSVIPLDSFRRRPVRFSQTVRENGTCAVRSRNIVHFFERVSTRRIPTTRSCPIVINRSRFFSKANHQPSKSSADFSSARRNVFYPGFGFRESAGRRRFNNARVSPWNEVR